MFELMHEFSHTHPWLFLGGLTAVGIIAAQVFARLFLACNGITMEQWKIYKDWQKWH